MKVITENINLGLEPELLKRMDTEARIQRVSRSRLARFAILYYLDTIDKDRREHPEQYDKVPTVRREPPTEGAP